MTMMSTGSSLPGRVHQIRQEAKSPSAVPASPPMTMVMPSPPSPLLHERRARRHGVLHLDHRADRHDVPFAAGEVAGEVTAPRVRVGRGHGHLADAVDQRHAHGDQGGAVAIVQVEVIEGGALALFDLQAEAGVERFLAGAADPEVAFARLAHLDHALFHGPAADHDAVRSRGTFRQAAIPVR